MPFRIFIIAVFCWTSLAAGMEASTVVKLLHEKGVRLNLKLISSIVPSPDGSIAYVSFGNGAVHLISIKTGKLLVAATPDPSITIAELIGEPDEDEA